MKMTQRFIPLALLAVITSFFLLGCLEDHCEETYTYTRYQPVYKQANDIRIPIVAEAPRALENPGKLYFYQNYVLINEIEKGIHVIDNANPASPQFVSFIPIPGNVDIAVKGGILYADNYMDMLAINIMNIQQPEVVHRVENAFSYYDQNEAGILVGYERTEEQQELDCESYRGQTWTRTWGEDMWLNDASASSEFIGAVDMQQEMAGNSVSLSTGIAGSMARFGIVDSYLYAIDEHYLDVYDISSLSTPNMVNEVFVGWGIETIFPYGEHLFIGAADGMYIFNNSTPTAPYEQSVFEHARACDPVYVSGNKAFVTLRDGDACETFTNQMDIVDISNLSDPTLIKSYEMYNPHGLSVTPSQRVYLCDGDAGFKVLDATDVYDVKVLGEKGGFHAYDVIALSESHLMVIGADGFYQFDATDPTDIQQLSWIPAP